MTPEWYHERFRSADSLTIAEQEAVRADYEAIAGVSFANSFRPDCPNRYHDAITQILLKMKQTQTNDRGGYLLKTGVVFKYKGKIITNSNLTAAAAEWYIAQNIERRDDFEELGKDYDSFASVVPAK